MPTWTSEPPTREGWYWHRRSLDECAIVFVYGTAEVANHLGWLAKTDEFGGEWWPVAIEPPGGAT